MKKSKLVISICLICFSLKSFSGNASFFEYNKLSLDIEFQELSELERYVESNPGVTLSQLLDDNFPVVSQKSYSNASSLNMIGSAGEPPLGINSFIWGCCLGFQGMVAVYMLSQEDPEETRKAFNGCLVNSAVLVVGYAALTVLSLTATY